LLLCSTHLFFDQIGTNLQVATDVTHGKTPSNCANIDSRRMRNRGGNSAIGRM
jgi:hypothetical protein